MGLNKILKRTILILATAAAALAISLAAVPSYAETSDVVYHDTEEEAVTELRGHMKQREENVTIGLKGSIDQEGLQAIIGRLIKEAIDHTGKPDEGDYIGFQYASYKGLAHTTYSGFSPAMEIEYTISYYDDEQQEAEVDKKIKEIIEGLELDDKTDFEKIAAIHDYICNNVEYVDDETENDITRTAYGALIDGKAVCQGYSVCLYRLLLEAGINNRIIFGKGLSDSGDSGAHTWNIIELNDEYYYMDVTWDDVGLCYDYFMVPAGAGFEGEHVADESFSKKSFSEKYPLAAEAYKNEAVGLLGKILKLKNGLMDRMKNVFSNES